MIARTLLPFLAFLGLTALPLHAECTGQNMFDSLPAATRAEITAKVDAMPYAQGNFWRATRGDGQMTLVGTYHLDDPRHAETLKWLAPIISTSTAVLVEAGRLEQKALADRIAQDPGLLVSDGPTLPELLPAQDWQTLSQAFSARGIPPVMGAKFRPWYVTALLAIPPCLGTQGATALGLDGAIITAATTHQVPVKALEPYDTVLGLFDSLSGGEEVAMIQSALSTEAKSADYTVTMRDAYFAGQSARVWQMTRAETLATPGADPEAVAQGFDKIERRMIIDRNRNWLPVIEAAAKAGPIVAAFGALHLPGENGLLNLLAQDGWTITPLTR